ncbi:MAG TPA: phosphatidylglycerophosphatase A [Limnobacter sp.]|uniref:phosphatidylglycerophosphatase A family protein n=1 Tax=Limnobacter sp. TaxID=2003368 RepID=UPI002EDA8C0A
MPSRKIRPDWKFALSNPAHLLALGFGSGLAWVVPGTFGTLFGWLTYVWMAPHIPSLSLWGALLTLAFGVGCVCCHITGRALGVADHGSIVWDEVVAIWLVLLVAAPVYSTPLQQLACVVVFRFFDMVKPPPIRWFDQRWKNGFGVMWDDIVAALISLFVLALAARWTNEWLY